MVKKILLSVLVLILAIAGYFVYKFSTNKGGGFDGEKAEKLEIKSETPGFDASLQHMVTQYMGMKDAFVEADTSKARSFCNQMIAAIDSLKLDEIKKDTTGIFATIEGSLNGVKENAIKVAQQTSIRSMREEFNQLNQQLYDLLNSVKSKYKGQSVYWHMCPMAFDGDKEAYWLDSRSEDARTNPYLGKNDPVYKSSMLHCGEQKDSVVAKK